MPKLRRLSGAEVVAIFRRFGFGIASQRGSHIKLKRATSQGSETLTVPAHRELDTGTLRAILRQASRFVPENDLRPYFYESGDQIHEPEVGELLAGKGVAGMTPVSLEKLVPAEWVRGAEAAVWLTCYQCMGVSKADLSAGARVIDLLGTRVVLLYGQVPYVASGDLVIHSKEQPEFHSKIEITRSPEEAYLLVLVPYDHEDQAAELAARERTEWGTGLLAAVIGRNAVYHRLFEHVSWICKPKW
jgi:predicted RNA binding protein YcfA (HicA-like mRNA interferase family)